MAEINVKYKSQWDSDASLVHGDCMQTCLAMMLSYFYDTNIHTNAITRIINSNTEISNNDPDLTSVVELQFAARLLGCELTYNHGNGDVRFSEQLIKENKPHIAIVDYSKADWKEDNYNGLHAVLIIGADSKGGIDGADKVYIINDPNHKNPNNKGKQIIPSYSFENAWAGTNYQILVPILAQ